MDVDWPAHLRWVRVQDNPINALDIGQGPAMLFLHGRRLLAELAGEHFRPRATIA